MIQLRSTTQRDNVAIIFTNKKDSKIPEKIQPSHHELPKKPGSDSNHEHEEKRDEDRKRSWDEHHPNPSRPKS